MQVYNVLTQAAVSVPGLVEWAVRSSELRVEWAVRSSELRHIFALHPATRV